MNLIDSLQVMYKYNINFTYICQVYLASTECTKDIQFPNIWSISHCTFHCIKDSWELCGSQVTWVICALSYILCKNVKQNSGNQIWFQFLIQVSISVEPFFNSCDFPHLTRTTLATLIPCTSVFLGLLLWNPAIGVTVTPGRASTLIATLQIIAESPLMTCVAFCTFVNI